MEQPDDWTEPGVYRIADGVFRVPLPLPFDGLRAVNGYVLMEADGPVLVDPGWAMRDTEKALVAALRELGCELGDVTVCVATHLHWDHYTQALILREKLGTRVLLGRGERHTIAAFDYRNGLHAGEVVELRRSGAPELAERIAEVFPELRELDMPFEPPDEWLDDGDRVGRLDVVATPGHTRGHVVLLDEANQLLLTGDHVLPHITPAIGFETAPEELPLRSYMQSLQLLKDMPDALLLPAHGPVTPSVHTRVDQLIAHHEKRLDAALTEVRRGADTAFAVADALPWTRRAKRFAEIRLMDQMMAVLEMDAHLKVLVDQGLLHCDESGDVRRFALAA